MQAEPHLQRRHERHQHPLARHAPRFQGLFQSFWLGGFESACQINTRGQRIDMLAATQHDSRAREDYRLLANAGIRTCRDGIRWPLIETSPGHYDWSSFLPMLRAAE